MLEYDLVQPSRDAPAKTNATSAQRRSLTHTPRGAVGPEQVDLAAIDERIIAFLFRARDRLVGRDPVGRGQQLGSGGCRQCRIGGVALHLTRGHGQVDVDPVL
jgi:hypothetical protein